MSWGDEIAKRAKPSELLERICSRLRPNEGAALIETNAPRRPVVRIACGGRMR